MSSRARLRTLRFWRLLRALERMFWSCTTRMALRFYDVYMVLWDRLFGSSGRLPTTFLSRSRPISPRFTLSAFTDRQPLTASRLPLSILLLEDDWTTLPLAPRATSTDPRMLCLLAA